MRTGLFGGTFNPIHNGHIHTIQFVMQHYELDQVFFIPSAQPPHKPDTSLAPASDRYELVAQSIEPYHEFTISGIELHRKGPSFTIDTVTHFIDPENAGQQFILIIGSDAFWDIGSWKSFGQIFKLIDVIVMQRPDYVRSLSDISNFIKQTITDGYSLDMDTGTFSHMKNKRIYICNPPEIPISSTQIRHRVKNRMPIAHLVPQPCNNLIETKGLYL